MKIIVVGGSGTIGSAVVTALKNKEDNQVISVGYSEGDIKVDITKLQTIIFLIQCILNLKNRLIL